VTSKKMSKEGIEPRTFHTLGNHLTDFAIAYMITS
jgi:hypothetical protein